MLDLLAEYQDALDRQSQSLAKLFQKLNDVLIVSSVHSVPVLELLED